MRRSRSNYSGLSLIELAVALPIFITILFGVGYLYHYIRVYQAVKYAAETGATIASSAQVRSVTNINESFINWSADDAPIRPVVDMLTEQCRTASNLKNCLTSIINDTTYGNRLRAVSWNGASLGTDFAKTYPLPFALYEQSASVPGWYPVQALPIIGVKRACFEPYNESNALMVGGNGRYYDEDAEDEGGCTQVKPMYWQNPIPADFDGDRKEDVVFFKPQGLATSWGAQIASNQIDFIVYYSGGFYSNVFGHGYFNLAKAPSGTQPAPIPIVADYDRDGVADYAVFEPHSGKYRIAFSASRYRIIGEGNAGVSDATDQLGLIAIPGQFSNKGKMELAIIKTGGDYSERFDIFVGDPLPSNFSYATLAEADPSQTLVLSGDIVQQTGNHKLKPHPATVSVPAFGDYDGDGITEIGYLSWYGGNLARQIGGSTKTSNALFETSDSPGTTLMQTKMNPFDLAFDHLGNLYYVDSVDARIWKVSADTTGRGDFTGSTVTTLMPNHASLETRASDTPESKFPRESVLNIPGGDTRTPPTTDDDITDEYVAQVPQDKAANTRGLKYPKKIVFATGYDNAMYVADFGNKRILRIKDSGGGEVTSSDDSRVVIGSRTCPESGLTACQAPATWNGVGTQVGQSLWAVDDLGNLKPRLVYPQALAIVQHESDSDSYYLAFSSGNDVYMITHSHGSGGPRGDATELLWHIAGTGNEPADAPTEDDTTYKYVTAGESHSTALCPIVDLKAVTLGGAFAVNNRALYAVSSCSAQVLPEIVGDLTRNVGGLIKLAPRVGTERFKQINDTSILAGSFLAHPCETVGNCAGPSSIGGYQRKIDPFRSLTELDIINPTDLDVIEPHLTYDYPIVYLTNQWNDGPETNNTRYPAAPNKTDRQHIQEIWTLYLSDSTGAASLPGNAPSLAGIVPFTNPFLFGGSTIPVASANWYSPYRLGAGQTLNTTIPAHEAPLKNIPFPANGFVAVNNQTLYASSPFLANPSSYNSTDPYYVLPENVGFIHKAILDHDGDGTRDTDDTDPDGDSQTGFIEGSSVTLATRGCAEIWGDVPANGSPCRYAELFGIPRLYFTKLDGGTLDLSSSDNSGPSNRTYGEYHFYNSVSESGGDGSAAARPEVWATLFNFGDDQDYSWNSTPLGCSTSNDSTSTSPYANCKNTSNGPIAIPQPLHALAGLTSLSRSDAGYYAGTNPGSDTELTSDSLLMLFPGILSSTHPRENGIKVTRNPPWVPELLTSEPKTPGIRRLGVLCEGSFNFNNNDGLLENIPYTAITEDEDDENIDNDNLGYYVGQDCSGVLADFPDGRKPAVEGVVLQLDHDDTTSKENGGSDGNWPNPFFTGSVGSQPENKRQFMLLDSDGDGLRDPAWLSSESIVASRTVDESGPYQFVTNTVITSDYAIAGEEARDPFTQTCGDAPNPNGQPAKPVGGYNCPDISSGWGEIPGKPIFAMTAAASGSNFDAQNKNNTANLSVSLDFEPYPVRGLKVTESEDFGASMFANYGANNRFEAVLPNTLPPALNAATAALVLSLGISNTDVSNSDDSPGVGEARVRFMQRDPDDATQFITCDTSQVLNLTKCDAFEVTYTTNIFGREVEVKSVKLLKHDTLTHHLQVCDPNAPDATEECAAGTIGEYTVTSSSSAASSAGSSVGSSSSGIIELD